MNKLVPLIALVAAGFGIAWVSNRPTKTNNASVRPAPVAPGYATEFEKAYQRSLEYVKLVNACSTKKDLATCQKAESERKWLALYFPKLLEGKTTNPCRVSNGKVVCSGGR